VATGRRFGCPRQALFSGARPRLDPALRLRPGVPTMSCDVTAAHADAACLLEFARCIVPEGCQVPPVEERDIHHTPRSEQQLAAESGAWPKPEATVGVGFEDASTAADLLRQLHNRHVSVKAPVPSLATVARGLEAQLHPWRNTRPRPTKRKRQGPSDARGASNSKKPMTILKQIEEAASVGSYPDGAIPLSARDKADPFAGSRDEVQFTRTGCLVGSAVFRRTGHSDVRMSTIISRSSRAVLPTTSAPSSRRAARPDQPPKPRRRRRNGRPQNYVCGGVRDPRHFFLHATSTHLFPRQYAAVEQRVRNQSHSGKKGRYYSARHHVCTGTRLECTCDVWWCVRGRDSSVWLGVGWFGSCSGCKEVFKGGAPLYRRNTTVQDNLYRALRLQACLDVGMLPFAVGGTWCGTWWTSACPASPYVRPPCAGCLSCLQLGLATTTTTTETGARSTVQWLLAWFAFSPF